jgi:hypothetical protein
MKAIYIFFISLLITSYAFGQNNNIVVFSNSGEKFSLILNGVRQNVASATNVKVTGLNQPGYKLKIIFENKSLYDVDRNISFAESDKEYVYSIQKVKGVYKLRYVSEAPIQANAPAIINQSVVVYNPVSTYQTQTTQTTSTTTNSSTDSKSYNGNTGITGQRTNTTDTKSSGSTHENVSININLNSSNLDLNMNANNARTNDISTSTDSRSTNNGSKSMGIAPNNSDRYIANGKMCSSPSISQPDFIKFKYDLDSRTIVTKMAEAQKKIKANCMLSSQVAEIVKLFDYADDQLEISKFSYQYTYDTKNYDVVLNSLKQDYNKPKLLDFIGSAETSLQDNLNPMPGTAVTTTTTTNTTTTTIPVSTSVNSPAGCYSPMYSSEFETAKKSISSKSFEDTKLTLAKQILGVNCFSTSQVKEIMQLFSFEETKLTFAKLAYDRTTDVKNYYQLNDAFTFESTIEELNTFVESKRK